MPSDRLLMGDVDRRVDAWTRAMDIAPGGMSIRVQNSDNVDGHIQRFNSYGMEFTKLNAAGITIQRVNPDINNIEGKNFFLLYQCDGNCVVEQGYNQTRVQSGDMVLLDTMQSFRVHYDVNAHQFCFHIPREMALHNWRYTRVKLAEKISAGSGLAGLITPLLREIARIGVTKPNQFEDDYLLNAILLLLEPLFTQKHDRVNQYQSIYLQRAMTFIDQNLCNEELDPQAVAGHLHVSLRHMQRLFKSLETSVSKLILEKRICACANDLINPRNAVVDVTSIAFHWGFKDSSYFSRVFRNYYGIPPSQYRKKFLKQVPAMSLLAHEDKPFVN